MSTRSASLPILRVHMVEPSQEVKSAAAAALKELALNEKQQVSLEEKRKHAKTKLKKLQKTVADVRVIILDR